MSINILSTININLIAPLTLNKEPFSTTGKTEVGVEPTFFRL